MHSDLCDLRENCIKGSIIVYLALRNVRISGRREDESLTFLTGRARHLGRESSSYVEAQDGCCRDRNGNGGLPLL